jgi:hypothetical protein
MRLGNAIPYMNQTGKFDHEIYCPENTTHDTELDLLKEFERLCVADELKTPCTHAHKRAYIGARHAYVYCVACDHKLDDKEMTYADNAMLRVALQNQ